MAFRNFSKTEADRPEFQGNLEVPRSAISICKAGYCNRIQANDFRTAMVHYPTALYIRNIYTDL